MMVECTVLRLSIGKDGKKYAYLRVDLFGLKPCFSTPVDGETYDKLEEELIHGK